MQTFPEPTQEEQTQAIEFLSNLMAEHCVTHIEPLGDGTCKVTLSHGEVEIIEWNTGEDITIMLGRL